jgi:peroxiredoxin
MRSRWIAVVAPPLLLVYASASFAQDGARAAERYRAIVDRYEKSQQQFLRATSRAKTDVERAKLLDAKPSPSACAIQLLELARTNPKTEVGFDALTWVTTHAADGPEIDEALRLLATDHAGQKRLGAVVQRLPNGRSEPAEKLLRAALQDSPHADVRALACYALATALAASPKRPDDGLEAKAGDPPAKSPRDEAKALFQMLATEFPNVKSPGKKTYGELGRIGLARLISQPGARVAYFPEGADPAYPNGHLLKVGDKAPEIVGEDTTGRAMRLSSYKGQVVVLHFWGHWCPACRDMTVLKSIRDRYAAPDRYAKRSLTLLGVNSDWDVEAVQRWMTEQGINWPSWAARNGRGPIPQLYGINRWPGVLVIDHKGVIRYQRLDGNFFHVELEQIIDTLLAELGEEPKELEKKARAAKK